MFLNNFKFSIKTFILEQIVEKSRYDEEAEEWIIPYTKKKNLENIESKNNSSNLLPDINKSSYLNKVSLGLDKLEKTNNEKENKIKPRNGYNLIPMLNLPGIIIINIMMTS